MSRRHVRSLHAAPRAFTAVLGLVALLGACGGELRRDASEGLLSPSAESTRSLNPGSRASVGGWLLSSASSVSEPGPIVSSSSFQPSGWFQATVPGTVLTTLVNQGVYPEPLYGLNNLLIPESLSQDSYWYRTTLSVPPPRDGARVWLNLDGINHTAEIWLNGAQIGEIRGAFKRAHLDITDALRAEGDEVLAVRVNPPPNPGVPHEQTLASAGQNGGVIGTDSPTFVATIGWDWMPGIRDRDTGIWQDVYLTTTGPVVVRNPHVITDLPLPSTDSADLTVSAEVANVSPHPVTGVLRGELEGVVFERPVTLDSGEVTTVVFDPAHDPELRLQHPRLWWPNGYGRPELYDLELSFVTGGATSDVSHLRFGVRELSYALAPELQISVNGQRIMAKGGNWGMDEAMKRNTRERFEAQIRFHKEANFTMIRNWVGMTDDETFYDLCDENGILIFDDFWLANPVDGPEPADTATFLDNARDKILRYRNHPSVALWCARNEGFAPPAIAAGLRDMLLELDGTRRFQESSADAGIHGHGPYRYQKPEEYFTTHAHGFTTEIGLPSIPTVESVHHMMPAQDWWPINDDWGYHDYTEGAARSSAYTSNMTSRYGAPTGLPDFCRKGAMMGYESFRAIFEAWNHRLWNDASGVLLWMSNAAQPSFVWQLYDYDLEPTASFFGAKKANEPLHIQLNLDDQQVIVVNNQLAIERNLVASASVYGLDGGEVQRESVQVDAAPNAITPLFSLTIPPLSDPVYFVKLELRDHSGQLRSDNFYWRSSTGDDLTALDQLPEVHLLARALSSRAGNDRALFVTVSNPSNTVAVAVRLKLMKGPTEERVLPVFYDDNYFSLLPGEERRVTVRFPDYAAHAGATPTLRLEGWNIAPGEVSTSPLGSSARPTRLRM